MAVGERDAEATGEEEDLRRAESAGVVRLLFHCARGEREITACAILFFHLLLLLLLFFNDNNR